MMKALCTVALAMAAVPAASASSVPAGDLPPGYVVLAEAGLSAGRPARSFEIVALGRMDEARFQVDNAPARPLLIFEKRGSRFVLVGRNDHVVMRADEGGQCDPFIDGGIAVKGRFFTIENGVACGQHWTDYITFRLNDRAGFVFDNERIESWSLNTSDAPNADALARDGPQRVRRDEPGHITPFSKWRPER